MKKISEVYPIYNFCNVSRLGHARLDSARLGTFSKFFSYEIGLSSETSEPGSRNRVSITGTVDLSSDAVYTALCYVAIGGTVDISSEAYHLGQEYSPVIHNLYFDETARLESARFGKSRLDTFCKSVFNVIDLSSDSLATGRQLITVGNAIGLISEADIDTVHRAAIGNIIDLSSYGYGASGFAIPIGAELDLLSESGYTSQHGIKIGGSISVWSDISYTSLNRVKIGNTISLSSYNLYSSLNRISVTGTLDLSSEFAILPLFHYTAIEVEGPFEVGDTIVIDSDKFSVTLNGENILDRMSGDFPTIIPGNNEIRYIDEETGRTVAFRIVFSERIV